MIAIRSLRPEVRNGYAQLPFPCRIKPFTTQAGETNEGTTQALDSTSPGVKKGAESEDSKFLETLG